MTDEEIADAVEPDAGEVADAIRRGIKEARLAAGLRQEDVAAALGVRQALISQWESSKVPTARNVIRLAVVLGTTPDALFRYALELERVRSGEQPS